MTRMLPAARKADILTAALAVAAEPGGWAALTRKGVADRAQCAEALVSRYFGTMPQLRRAVMRAAVTSEYIPVIAQGLAAGDKQAQKIRSSLKSLAVLTLVA